MPPKKHDEKPLPVAMEEDLHCGICTELLFRCLTVMPCGHNFCSPCFARWRRTSPACPECRSSVRQAVRNVAVDAVVKTFSEAPPSAARSPRGRALMEAAKKEPDIQQVLRWLFRSQGPPT